MRIGFATKSVLAFTLLVVASSVFSAMPVLAQRGVGGVKSQHKRGSKSHAGATTRTLRPNAGAMSPKDAATKFGLNEKGLPNINTDKNSRGGAKFSTVDTNNKYFYLYRGKFDGAKPNLGGRTRAPRVKGGGNLTLHDLNTVGMAHYAQEDNYCWWPEGNPTIARTGKEPGARRPYFLFNNTDFSNPVVAPPEESFLALAELIAGTVVSTNANAIQYQWNAEQSFRDGHFVDAAYWVRKTIDEDQENGKLHLFAAQILFATGKYRSGAGAIHQAASMLEQNEWGFVVENAELFYVSADHASQMHVLENYVRENPYSSYAHLLLGYQYLFTGNRQAAAKHLTLAVKLEDRDLLAKELLRVSQNTVADASQLP